MKDESRGLLPSASSIGRYAACNGAFLLSAGIEAFRTKEMVEWAESGDRVHEALGLGAAITTADLAKLSPDETEVFGWCLEQTNACIAKTGISQDAHVIRETRLWIVVDGKKVLSGKADYQAIEQTNRVGLVLDYKSNRGEQDPVDENYQIRTGIVLAAEANPYIETWYGAIVQPLVTSKPELVKYGREEVAMARAELVALLEKINRPGAPTTAGIHCKYCPAILKCDSARALLQTFGLMDETTEEGMVLSEYLVLAKAAKPIIKRLEDHARDMLTKDPASVPGWQIGAGTTQRAITDTLKCFTLVTQAGLLDRDTFLNKAVGVSVGDLEAAVAKFKGIKKSAAKDEVNAVCLTVIEFKPKAGSLEQV